MYDIQKLKKMQDYFNSGATRSLESRMDLLNKLEAAIKSYSDPVAKALYQDLRKPEK